MPQNFWDSFYANLFANLAVVAILALVGYLAKHRLVKNIRKFIANEVDETIKQIKDNPK